MAFVSGLFAPELEDKILGSRVLVVGAGGIGCEILKNMVLSGFKRIEIIDLDTIDVSNLNRQFLFHKEHVGKSKSQVARESALAFNPNVEIVAHHDSITSNHFGIGYFQTFSLVLNALDNRAARNHVNRMCLTAGVPLIESGTAGYNGQVEVIKKGLTQCYECTPKAAQKSFPGCTIRNTPSEPIHCIVWAKHLFNQIFGEDNAEEDVSPDTADPEAAAEAGEGALNTEANAQGNVTRQSTRAWAQACDYDEEKLFNKLFHDDIKYLLSMANLWRTRTPPTPMRFADSAGACASEPDANGINLRDQVVWNLSECAAVFRSSLAGLREQFKALPAGDHLVWDKDDRHGMDFVAACANVRANIFHIPQKSRFEIKSMAGNIIPAIATTNAITAGIVILHAFKVLLGTYEACPNVYMRLRPNARNQIITADKFLNAPNPKCYVCSAKPEVTLRVDTGRLTIKELRDEVLIKAMNMIDPDVLIDGTGTIVLSSEEGETEANNGKTLAQMSIVDGSVLRVDDFHQNYELTVIIVDRKTEYDQALFEVIASPGQLAPEAVTEVKPPEAPVGNGSGKAVDVPEKVKRVEPDADDDACVILEEEEGEDLSGVSPTRTVAKRKSAGDSTDPPPSKKSKLPDNLRASSSKAALAAVDEEEDIICIDD